MEPSLTKEGDKSRPLASTTPSVWTVVLRHWREFSDHPILENFLLVTISGGLLHDITLLKTLTLQKNLRSSLFQSDLFLRLHQFSTPLKK